MNSSKGTNLENGIALFLVSNFTGLVLGYLLLDLIKGLLY